MQGLELPAEILTRFRTLSIERIERIEASWLSLLERTADPDLAAELRRDLHTVKGDAHVVGFVDVNTLCHRLEGLLAFAEEHAFEVQGPIDLMMTMGLRFAVMLILGTPSVPVPGVDLDGFLRELENVLSDARAATEKQSRSQRPSGPAAALGRTEHLGVASRERLSAAAVRVFIEMANASGEARTRLGEALASLRQVVRGVTSEPLDARLPRHVHAAMDLARVEHKEIFVDVRCHDIDVPPEIAEALDVALLHTLRNAVHHGVEPKDLRKSLGKCSAAAIGVTVSHRDGVVEIRITDDGRGVDWQRVRQVAVERRLLTQKDALERTDAQLHELLFASGFSTSNVNEVAGRGVGLDAVRSALKQWRGSAALETKPGTGTTVILNVPHSSPRVAVHRFKPPGSSIPLAVSTRWTVAAAAAPPRSPDLLGALGIRPWSGPRDEPRGWLRLERGDTHVVVPTKTQAEQCWAERILPTAPDQLAELIMIEGAECLLVRPELLAAAEATSSR